MLSQIFRSILLLSCVGGALFLILLTLKPITKRVFGSSWQYYMWLTVLIVMVLPVTFKLPVNTPQIPEQTPSAQIMQDSNVQPIPEQESVNANDTQVTQNNAAKPSIMDNLNRMTVGVYDLLIYVWLCGACLFLCMGLINYWLFLRTIRKNSVPISCPELYDMLLEKGMKNRVGVRSTDYITAPLMVGVFRSTLLLPNTTLTENELRYVLLHELTHLKRRDLWYKWFSMLVNALHWFNPLVYFTVRQINEECEISCDLSVTQNMTEQEKSGYMNTILTILSQSKLKKQSLSTAMASDKKQIKRRFMMIKNANKSSKFTVLVSVISAALILGVTVLASGVLASGLYNDEYKTENELPMSEFNGGIRTFYAVNHSLEENVQHAFGIPYGESNGITATVGRVIPYYIDENGKKIESYYKGEAYYGVMLGWKENNEENNHLISKTVDIEGKMVNVGFTVQSLPYEGDKVINKMIETQIAFELGIGYDDSFGGYDHTVFVNELICRGIYTIERVIEPQNFEFLLHNSMDNSYLFGSKILTKYDKKEKINDIFNDKVEMPKNVDGNQGIQLGNTFTLNAGETLAIDIKETSKELYGINWAIVDADTGNTVMWMPNATDGERWVFIPLEGMEGKSYKLKVSTAENGWCDFEIFTYITDISIPKAIIDGKLNGMSIDILPDNENMVR